MLDGEGATAHLQIDSLRSAMRAAIVGKRDRYEHALLRIIAEGIRRLPGVRREFEDERPKSR